MMKISSVIKLLILLFMLCSAGCDFRPDTLEVVRWSPENHSRGVVNDAFFEMEFSSNLNKRDIEENFSMHGASGSVAGRFTWLNDKSFRFTPLESFSKNGRYVVEVPRSVRDRDGNTMGSDFISDFYVGDDFEAPVILGSFPPAAAGAVTGIAVNSTLFISFSKSMNRESVEKSFRLSPDAAGYYLWSESAPGLVNSLLTYVTVKPMDYGKLYALTVAGTAEDYAGNALGSEYRVHFITGEDRTPPEILRIYDADDLPPVDWSIDAVNSGIERKVKIAVEFSEPMNRQSLENSFSITPSVAGIFEWDSDLKVVFKPSALLNPETKYQVRIDTGARDLNGLKLAEPYITEFITNGLNSVFLNCTRIEGSSDGISYTVLSDGVPGPGEWPLKINMGGGDNQKYRFRIHFYSGAAAADLKIYSFFDNHLLETFKSGMSSPVENGVVEDISLIAPSTVEIRTKGLTNSALVPSGYLPYLYRFTISGGARGIKDRNDNYMKNDLVFEFQEDWP